MHTVKGYWGLMGKRFMLGALIFPAVRLFSHLIGLTFSTRGSMRAFSIYIYLFVGIGLFALGFVLLIADIRSDKKLQHLKKVGKAYKPIDVTVQADNISRNSLFVKNRYRSFRVTCTLRNSKGNDIIVRSRELTVCDGWFIVPQPFTIACGAIVYVNPNESSDFAIDVWIK